MSSATTRVARPARTSSIPPASPPRPSGSRSTSPGNRRASPPVLPSRGRRHQVRSMASRLGPSPPSPIRRPVPTRSTGRSSPGSPSKPVARSVVPTTRPTSPTPRSPTPSRSVRSASTRRWRISSALSAAYEASARFLTVVDELLGTLDPAHGRGREMSSMRVTNSMMVRSTLRDLNLSYGRLARTQEQLSSGRQIVRASDDPAVAADAMNLRGLTRRSEQYARSRERRSGPARQCRRRADIVAGGSRTGQGDRGARQQQRRTLRPECPDRVGHRGPGDPRRPHRPGQHASR